ncbi:MAG: hypothetical protein WC347_02845 [Smithellaceae bacterium]|jgi:hypothetical protein
MKITVTVETVFNDKKIIKTATADIPDEFGPIEGLNDREQQRISETTKTLLREVSDAG